MIESKIGSVHLLPVLMKIELVKLAKLIIPDGSATQRQPHLAAALPVFERRS